MSTTFTTRRAGEEPPKADPDQEAQCLRLLDRGCQGPGVLKVAVTDHALAVRWAVPKSLTKCPSKQGLSFALNLAPATQSYRDLMHDDAKYEWVQQKALGADQWNRGTETGGLLTGVVSAFHGLDKVCYRDAPEAEGKSYPHSSKSGRCTLYMPGDPGAPEYNVLKMDAFATRFCGEGTASLNMDKPALRKLMDEIDKKEGALFLKDTCWKLEFYDERTKPAKEDPEVDAAIAEAWDKSADAIAAAVTADGKKRKRDGDLDRDERAATRDADDASKPENMDMAKDAAEARGEAEPGSDARRAAYEQEEECRLEQVLAARDGDDAPTGHYTDNPEWCVKRAKTEE